ncbi:RNA polymerase sigma factor [Dinghuibacter silviterrae]|uniref:RNA polymerase sigma factor (Sigma-70 family) n=1 Tax=Dinghuibacter silviterrae TaxID=1539049 RepID=A0A4R8DI34_9BACT|nr:sigma-70 family RNA polymerase sigma factor [Dinghuibacter silviterrae]TDW97128.1 RNA polymerase sigma factor (sigma-70 family) [Dinghuibacter silviterrae]
MFEDKDLAAIQNGDELALARIIAAFYQTLTRFAFRYLKDMHDAEDIAMLAIHELWNKRLSVHNARHAEAFLHRVAKHLCIDLLRQKRRRKVSFFNPQSATFDHLTEDHDKAICKKLDAPAVHNFFERAASAIEKLPKQQKKVIRQYLRDEHLSMVKIAEKLKMNPKTAFAHKYEALKNLRTMMGDHDPR